MLASRFCCAVTALLLGLSCLFGVTKHAVAQNAKGAGGQNCGCAKTSKGVGQTGAMPNQQYMLFNQVVAVPMASSAMPGQQHHKHHHHSTGQTMYPGQTTPWLMPSQPGYLVTNQQTAVTAQPGYNFAQPIQQPMIGQPLYNMGQPNQPGLYQQQLVQQQFVAIPIVPAAGQVPPAVNQPAYNFGQPNQPGYGLINQPVNQPGYGLINQPVNQPGYGLINQPVNQPGYAVPNQNVPSSFVYQPPQGTTPWLMQTSTQQNQATTGFGTNLSSAIPNRQLQQAADGFANFVSLGHANRRRLPTASFDWPGTSSCLAKFVSLGHANRLRTAHRKPRLARHINMPLMARRSDPHSLPQPPTPRPSFPRGEVVIFSCEPAAQARNSLLALRAREESSRGAWERGAEGGLRPS